MFLLDSLSMAITITYVKKAMKNSTVIFSIYQLDLHFAVLPISLLNVNFNISKFLHILHA
jgi:hypothetical protein